MENLAIIESFGEFKDEKNIDRATLMAIIEDAFRNQLRKKYESDDNFDIIVNPDKGDLEIWRNHLKTKLNQRGFHEQFTAIKKLGVGKFAQVFQVKRC